MSNFNFPDMPKPDFARMEKVKNESLGRYDAEGIFKHLRSRIRGFQNTLDEKHEVGLQLANFGIAATLHIRALSFKNPNLIEFIGLSETGEEVLLVQHISQLSFLLVAVAPVKETGEAYRVGFS